ncbi:olfactory receptor 6N2-like [Megalops cyprinoides]|uniref:olfactory receptor 6N2-like n=1 Tax=Megalops cyprinoides TaxID=118141 RepID=UPI00186443CD|nr:olfactory receptor 6N2-like [Megalops cyprinoides]
MENSSSIEVFYLSGLNKSPENQHVYFPLTLLLYIVIIFVNLRLISIILLEKTLHEPMYLLLCNLCFNGLYGTAGFYPKFLSDLLSDSNVISHHGCFLQVFVLYSSVKCDFATLTAMAYDRYVAICKPLVYHSVMTDQMVFKLIAFCWIFPYFTSTVVIILSSTLPLCGSHIDKLYCENWAIVKLSCKTTTLNDVTGYIVTFVYLGFAFFIIFSYLKLIAACTKSKEDRLKFTKTCLPHLLAVINFTIAIVFDLMYSRYGSTNIPHGLRNFFAVQFLIIPPIFNPVIYGLKMTEVRKRLLKQCHYLK